MVPLGKELKGIIFEFKNSILKRLFKKHQGKIQYGWKFDQLNKD